MSSHWKFEVHVKTPGEKDDEQATVEQFADLVQSIARILDRDDLEVTVSEVERN
jgi:hypothetical protein